jgi:hypothetical protein
MRIHDRFADDGVAFSQGEEELTPGTFEVKKRIETDGEGQHAT